MYLLFDAWEVIVVEGVVENVGVFDADVAIRPVLLVKIRSIKALFLLVKIRSMKALLMLYYGSITAL